MSQIYNTNSTVIKSLLKGKKFKIDDSLTESLIRSLSTKIFYTLAHYKLFDKLEGAIELGDEVVIYPYQSVVDDIRYIIELKGLQESPIIVQWNGKFDINEKKKKALFFVNMENFNVTDSLDDFVAFEQRVVATLHTIEDDFFKAVPANMNRVSGDE